MAQVGTAQFETEQRLRALLAVFSFTAAQYWQVKNEVN